MQRRVVAHVRVPTLPVERPLQLPHGVRDGPVEDVDDPTPLPADVHHGRVHGAYAYRALVRRLPAPAGVERGPVEDDLPAVDFFHVGPELPEVRVF